jgi:hypothetical protein
MEIMKSTTLSALLAAIIGFGVAPVFAQDAQPVTRAQIKAELVALEQAGYNPAYSHGPDYPADFQVAQRKVAAKQAQAMQYGPSTNGTSESGSR